MALATTDGSEVLDLHADVKQLCGYRIEQERRLRGLSQVQLGRRAGLSRDWVRQVESGYPKVKLDDYWRCLSAINLSPLILVVPMLVQYKGLEFSPTLLTGDLAVLEREILDAILNWTVTGLHRSMGAS